MIAPPDDYNFIFDHSPMTQPQAPQPFDCQVCYPKDDEVVRLMYNLRNLITKQHKKIVDTQGFKSQPSEDKNLGAIEKFIRFVFIDKLPAGFSCKHRIVEQFLLLKTKLSRKEVNYICDSIYQFEAKRNYQIEVLMNQIKCFPKSIVEELGKKGKQTQGNAEKGECGVKVESPVNSSNEGRDSQEVMGESMSPGSGMNIPYYYYPYYFQAVGQGSFHGFYNQAM